MAISKQITFEGLKYNLDDRDRVAAAAAVGGVPIVVSHTFTSGSAHAELAPKRNAPIFVADRTYTIKSVNLCVTSTGSAAGTIDFTVDGGTQHAGSGSTLLDSAQQVGSTFTAVAGQTETGGTFGKVTGSLSTSATTLEISSSQRLSSKFNTTGTGDAAFSGVVTFVLQTKDGHGLS